MARITTSGAYIPEIDGLRFVAIGSVFLFHVVTNPSVRGNPGDAVRGAALVGILDAGNFGVQAFFVISGFVLAIPFLRHSLQSGPAVRLRSYYLRRLTRLEPPYIVAMIGCFLLLVIVRGASPAALLPHLSVGLVYLHNITYGLDDPVNRVAWSLEVEVQFYVLVPLLAMMFRIRRARTRRLVLVTAILLLAAIGPMVAATSPHTRDTLLSYGQYFLAGFLLADLHACGRLRPARRPLPWDGAAVVAAALIVWLHLSVDQPRLPAGASPLVDALGRCALPLACVLGYCGVFKGTLVRRALTLTWVTVIGGMCYSIYLLHDVVLSYLLPVSTAAIHAGDAVVGLAVQILIAAAAVLAVSVGYFVLIERPCMDRTWPSRLRRQMRLGLHRVIRRGVLTPRTPHPELPPGPHRRAGAETHADTGSPAVAGATGPPPPAGAGGGIVMRMTEDRDIRGRIGELIAEEHRLRRSLGRSEISGDDERRRLTDLETQLDQCWDLLRQRDAAREFGTDPNAATVRDAATVENYLD